MAQAGCWDRDRIPKSARIVEQNDGTRLVGLGGKITESGTLFEIDLCLRIHSVPVTFQFRAVEITTPGLTVLWDLEQIRDKLGGDIDTVRSLLKSETLGFVIRLEPIEILNRRMSLFGIVSVGACGGMATDLLALLEMGFKVKTHYLIEPRENAVKIAKKLASFCNVELVVFTDIRNVSGSMIGFVHSAVFTPICAPWSGLPKNPLGFRSPNAYTFVECGRLRLELMKINPDMCSLFETNRVHPKLRDEQKRQEQLSGAQFMLIQASCFSSPSNRLRRMAPLNYIMEIREEDYTFPSTSGFTQKGWRTQYVPTPCVLSVGTDTEKDPISMIHDKTGMIRDFTPDEADALQGLVPGFSSGSGEFDITDKERFQMTGGCLNQFMMRIMFRNLDLAIRNSKTKLIAHLASDIGDAHPHKLEKHLRALIDSSQKDIDDYFRARLADHPPYDMVITPKHPDQMSYQTRFVPKVPQKFVKSARKKLAEMFTRKHPGRKNGTAFSRKFQKDIKPEDWISPAFMKGKGPGRVDLDGDELLRMLMDCGVLNANVDLINWWKEFGANIEDFKAEFPETSGYFCIRDLTNAFERVGAAKASEKYLVFVIKVEDDVIYIQAHICVQGLALSAYYFPVWWFRLMFRCFGYMFLLFIATYVDDNVIHGPTEDRVYYRNLMFESFCRIAEIEISEKTPALIVTEALGAGIVLSKDGLSTDGSVKRAMEMRIEVPVGGVKQARNLRGILQAGRTVVHPGVGQAHTFSQHMSFIDRAISISDKTGKWPSKFWHDEVIPQLQALKGLFLILPRAHIHPDSLITAGSCLFYLTDSSDEAAGGCLYKVMIPDARDVRVPEDLMDPMISQMVASTGRAHHGEKVHWLTYTNETEIAVEILEKTGKRVTAVIQAFGPTDMCKVGLGTDSSTAKSICQGLNDPACKPEHHTAMARKWRHWSERVEFTIYWNMYFAHCKGEVNHFSDWLSHIGHLLEAEAERLSSRKHKTKEVLTVSEDKAISAMKKRFQTVGLSRAQISVSVENNGNWYRRLRRLMKNLCSRRSR
jgi:hypothetical protein